MKTAGVVVLVIVLLLIATGIGWVVFTRIRAQRLGLPPPSLSSYLPFLRPSPSSSYGGPAPAPGGIVGWFNDRRSLFRNRNKRTAAGAYEGPAASSSPYNAGYASTADGNRDRGRGPVDPDDAAWDSRVGGYNPYDEERELGPAPPLPQGYRPDGEGYQMNLAVPPPPQPLPRAGAAGEADEESRGRTRSRSPGAQQQTAASANPFADEAEPSNLSLRGVSPRPM
ncbi:hypothetical protein BT67DRAFT_336785, partial [Trichocladium antarcticum]